MAVLAQHFAQDTRRMSASELRESHCGLGVTLPRREASVVCDERKHMSGPHDVFCLGARVGKGPNGPCPIVRGNSRTDAPRGIHGDAEIHSRGLGVLVRGDHERERQAPCLTMKFTVSGVAASASIKRSPSFSRRGSSTSSIMPPFLSRASASGTVESFFDFFFIFF